MSRARAPWLTWPNVVTLLRLVLVVPLCWGLLRGGSVLTVVLLAAWAGTDWVDGALARRLGQVSRLGEVLDPVADRLGIVAVALTMAVVGLLPWWVLGVVAAVDVAVAVAVGRRALRGTVRVSTLGKVRTAALFVGLVGLAAASSLGGAAASSLVGAGATLELVSTAVVVAGTVLHAVAGCGYLRQARARPRARGDLS